MNMAFAFSNWVRRAVMSLRYRTEETSHPDQRQLLVDVSTIIRADVRTGIQRVVRAILGQLVQRDLAGFVIQPVFASRNHGFCKAVFNPDGSIENATGAPERLQPVTVRPGDIFLGLDLSAHVLPRVENQIASWRRRGVSINLVIYDLLPLTSPQWFSPLLARNFARWFGFLGRRCDRCICISRTVAADLERMLSDSHVRQDMLIDTIPLGADIEASFPSGGGTGSQTIDAFLKGQRSLLTVGTIEPRKGHKSLLDALDNIWRSDDNSDIALIIVGRAGWKTDDLQERIRNHPELGRRLLWLSNADDEQLSQLYQECAGLVSASYQEGFGLPLIEAAAHGAPILCRDIPVFREVGGALFSYFDKDDPVSFSAAIQNWLKRGKASSRSAIHTLPTWADSADALIQCLGIPISEECAVS